ncbi:MAG: hypothetical protein KJO05_05605 [Bacteroidia bacterium]|nr:hypothetical protein [Bacteroidia bacterium]NNF29816.1 hypothetical protein [Flavobacteriaceae bacterium]MBT8275984.1 hypothetical protein [Bacteroidia bacterium]NNJ80818.1 hypothetical protein [Flavobacteriaceae bacterium]NNK55358.1 hypothetical protein [Flavobacteriaceae bacterium]
MKSLAFLFVFFVFNLSAQELKKADSRPLDAETFVGVDSYNNTYFIKDMVLHKTGPLGEFVFRDYQLGPVSSVDIINPLNVVVFYQEVNTVVLVDNRLNEIERINFNNLEEFVNVGAASNAGNNRLWIFNIDTQQLELYNYRGGGKILISQPISDDVLSMASDFNYCYLLTSKAIQKYNIYGSFLSELAVDDFQKIVQQNERLIALKNNELYYQALIDEDAVLLLSPIKLPLSENNIKDLQLTQEFLYIYDGLNIHSFTLTQPKQ